MRKITILMLVFALILGGALYSQEIAKTVQKEEKTTSELQGKIQELINQLGDDDWQTRDTVHKELTRRGEELIHQYRNIKLEIEKLAQSLHEGCKAKDPEIKMRSNQIRQYLYSLTQPKPKHIWSVRFEDGETMTFIMDAASENAVKVEENIIQDNSLSPLDEISSLFGEED